MKTIRYTIPGKPVPKQRPRIGKVGGHAIAFTPPKTRSEEGAVRMFASAAMGGEPPLEGPLEVDIFIYTSIPQSWSRKKQAAARSGATRPTGKPDIDNTVKLQLDSVNHIVWNDDSQIVNLTAKKFYSDQPRVEVEVRQIGG